MNVYIESIDYRYLDVTRMFEKSPPIVRKLTHVDVNFMTTSGRNTRE
jgi:hypothetical protein